MQHSAAYGARLHVGATLELKPQSESIPIVTPMPRSRDLGLIVSRCIRGEIYSRARSSADKVETLVYVRNLMGFVHLSNAPLEQKKRVTCDSHGFDDSNFTRNVLRNEIQSWMGIVPSDFEGTASFWPSLSA